MIARAAAAITLAALAACSKAPQSEPGDTETVPTAKRGDPAPPAGPIVPVTTESPAGVYKLDKSHASLTFKVDHIRFSNYTGEFKDFDATLEFDPVNPERMSVEATIDPTSLDVPSPPDGFLAELAGPQWLDAARFPQVAFRSTTVELTGPDKARVTGELTLHGITAPVALDARFNGGYKGFPPYDPNARIGFSATGSLSRSAFGVAFGLPPEGSTMGVGDEVRFEIEAEFNGPPVSP